VVIYAVTINDPTTAATVTLTGVSTTSAGNYTCDVFITALDADTATYL
jgi:hypothetical protein